MEEIRYGVMRTSLNTKPQNKFDICHWAHLGFERCEFAIADGEGVVLKVETLLGGLGGDARCICDDAARPVEERATWSDNLFVCLHTV